MTQRRAWHGFMPGTVSGSLQLRRHTGDRARTSIGQPTYNVGGPTNHRPENQPRFSSLLGGRWSHRGTSAKQRSGSMTSSLVEGAGASIPAVPMVSTLPNLSGALRDVAARPRAVEVAR